jgi:hypothetical protein
VAPPVTPSPALPAAPSAAPPVSPPAETIAPQTDEAPIPLRAMSGIERMELEAALAAERQAALDKEEERRREAEAAAAAGAAEATGAGPAAGARAGAVALPRQRIAVPRVSVPARLRPGSGAVAIVAPTLVAAAVWGLLAATGRTAVLDTERLRMAGLALTLAGPGSLVAAVMARIWWPRLVGVVAIAGLAALLIMARALLLD